MVYGSNEYVEPGYLFSVRDGSLFARKFDAAALKEALRSDLEAVCGRDGDPDLMNKIADERQVTTVDQLVGWLKGRSHPALQMSKMF